MLFIRNLRYSDITTVHRMVQENLKEEYDPGLLWQFAESWVEGSLVAEDMGNILGYLLAFKHTTTEARILLFVIIPSNQSRGLGTSMLTSFMNQCAIIGLKSVCLEVRVSNRRAIKFYTKFGFTIHSVLEHYYRDGETAYLMRRYL